MPPNTCLRGVRSIQTRGVASRKITKICNRKGEAFPHIRRQSRERFIAMGEINVQLNDSAPVPVPSSTTVAEALKKLDRDQAKQALATRVNGREVDPAYPIPAPE